MRIYDKNEKLIYENSLSGEALREHWAKTLGLGWFEFDGVWCTASGSLIAAIGLHDLHEQGHSDIAYHIELAARKYHYIEAMDVKSYEVIWGIGIQFTELET